MESNNKIQLYGSVMVDNENQNALDKMQKIDKLESNIADMETMIKNMQLTKLQNNQYLKIKSLNNGMELGLIKTPNTVFQNERTGANLGAYMVSVNNGCLSVGANDYGIYQCDDKNPKQLFKIIIWFNIKRSFNSPLSVYLVINFLTYFNLFKSSKNSSESETGLS